MIRLAVRLRAKCNTPPSALRPRDTRRHHHCSSNAPVFSCRSLAEVLPSCRTWIDTDTAYFSSAPSQLEVGENGLNEYEAVPHHIDAASHATLKATKDERREIHNNEVNRVSAAERRKIHEAKFNKAAKKKEMARRKILAEELMRIFAANNDFFNVTLQEMNVNSNGTELHQYREFYLDSLKSFGTMLSEEDEDVMDQVGLSAAIVVNLLNQFATVGSSGSSLAGNMNEVQEFSKKYRMMAALSQREEKLNSTLKRLRKNHGNRLQEMKSTLDHLRKKHKARLRKLEQEKGVLESVESQQEREGGQIASLEQKVLMSKETVDYFDESEMDELDKIEKEIAKTLTQVETLSKSKTDKDLKKQRNKVNNAKVAAANLSIRVGKLESEISGLKKPMTDQEFDSTTKNILTNIVPYVAPALAKFITNRHDDFDKYRQLAMHTDLTKPHEWYLHARLDKRKIIFHAGPTNSGKTYNALQRLKKAEKGMYLAPLRLLAAETYENLTAEGIYTELLTGQEHREVPFSTHRSSTVELACLDKDYDVVVIDEIQMLRDEFRGFAWTRALLGVRCKEIHVCGGAEAVDIVRKMCDMCGDDFELHKYERFSDLKVLEESLAKSPTEKRSYQYVQPGDCVVAFSKQDIFAIKREIETLTSFKCCVIYGSLPPGVRAEQARRFNDPNSEYKILVASDAIGMGLNLSIKRIIFNSMLKYNGDRIGQLDQSSVKQIAGRAGRRNSLYPNGEVTCRDPNDMSHLNKCMGTEIPPLSKAGIIPTPSHMALFHRHFEEYSSSGKEIEVHHTVQKFAEMATLKGDFFLCRKKSMEIVTRWLKDIEKLTPAEKFLMCMSPVNESCMKSKNTLLRYVETYTSGKIPGLSNRMLPRPASSFNHLADLCGVHHQLELFLWLQNKFPSSAMEVLRAESMKERTIQMINSSLLKAEKLSLSHDYVSKDVRAKKVWASEREGEGT